MERNETNMSCERYNEKHLMIRPRSETPQLEASRCRRFFCSTPPPINERSVETSKAPILCNAGTVPSFSRDRDLFVLRI